ncbi:hypothetical protein PIB30_053324 [Stylosanthes scabra]|uniref:Uncharacterized protein n=1 Tax=Stylosanthes scabra TaxID=79078 RepID=A0ABU6QIA1_9FABA|nr:hypothetical protein [Stylosanthes scabra]
MSNPNVIVATLYPVNELKRDVDRDVDSIGFASPNPILFYIQRVDTLDELKHIILHTMEGSWFEVCDDYVCAMFNLHHRYEPHQMMELLAETRNVARSEGGPSSSRPPPPSAIAAPPLRIAAPEVSIELDSNSDDGSDEEFMGEIEESSENFDGVEFVDETSHVRSFLLPMPAAILDLSSVSSHFTTKNAVVTGRFTDRFFVIFAVFNVTGKFFPPVKTSQVNCYRRIFKFRR